MDLIVKSRVCRYRDREYVRGERIENVEPRYAKVLVDGLGKCVVAPPEPVGLVASTQSPEPATDTPLRIPVEHDEAAPPAPEAKTSRRRYARRDLQAED